jgi:hypothetical protein
MISHASIHKRNYPADVTLGRLDRPEFVFEKEYIRFVGRQVAACAGLGGSVPILQLVPLFPTLVAFVVEKW